MQIRLLFILFSLSKQENVIENKNHTLWNLKNSAQILILSLLAKEYNLMALTGSLPVSVHLALQPLVPSYSGLSSITCFCSWGSKKKKNTETWKSAHICLLLLMFLCYYCENLLRLSAGFVKVCLCLFVQRTWVLPLPDPPPNCIPQPSLRLIFLNFILAFVIRHWASVASLTLEAETTFQCKKPTHHNKPLLLPPPPVPAAHAAPQMCQPGDSGPWECYFSVL